MLWRLILTLLSLAHPASLVPVLQLTAQPFAVARQPFFVQPAIELRDSGFGEIEASTTYNVRVVIPNGDIPLLGRTLALVHTYSTNGTYGQGSYTFTDLMIERPASGYFLEFEVLTSDDPPLAIEGTRKVLSTFFSVEVPFAAIAGDVEPTGEIVAGFQLLPIPSVALLNRFGTILREADNVVFVSVVEITNKPTTFPPLVLSSRVSDHSCCRRPTCLQSMARMVIECDCGHPDAGLCAVPSSGIVRFHNLTVNKVGRYVLKFRHEEIMFAIERTPRREDEEPRREIYTYQDSLGFGIVAGRAEKLAVVDQPATVFIGNITGDEAALLRPQPTCAYSDNQRNAVPIGDSGYAVAVPCIDFNDPNIANIPPQYLHPRRDICACNDEACILAPSTISAARNWGANLFGGNLGTGFDRDGIARFTDLNTKLARSDLRVACRFARKDEDLAKLYFAETFLQAFVLTTEYIVTDTFRVLPGRLATLIPISSPANVASPNCTRCPPRLQFPAQPLKASVQLLDSNHNELALCTAASQFCAGAPNALVFVELYVGTTKVSDIPPGNLHGSTETNARLGKAFFNGIKIAKSQAGYRLRFLAQAYDFLKYGSDLASKRIITADSGEFIVVNGAPSTIELRVRPNVASDGDPFPAQPVFAILDIGGNFVRSDCYSDCNGRLTSTCSETSASILSECAPKVEVSVVGLKLPTRVFGTLTSAARQGLATFTDLGIDSGVDLPSGCMCGEASRFASCTMCHCDVDGQCQPGRCLPPPPFPNYLLRASLQGSNNLPIEVPITLVQKVRSMVIVQQPEDSVAKEIFVNEVQVGASNCAGELITTVGAMVTVSLNNHPPGILFGTFPVRMVAGVAIFTDLSILDDGKDYQLKLSWLGFGEVEDILTTSFYIAPPLYNMLLISSPSDRIATAGVVFKNQPQIALLDSAGKSVTGTNAMVTAALSDNPVIMHPDGDKSDLGGTRIVQSWGGKAIFTDLVLTKASLGQGYEKEAYTIVFMVQVIGGEGLRVQTAALFVQPSTWAGLLILPSSQPGTFTAGRPFDVHVRVMLVDDFKNKLLPNSAPAGTMVDVLLISSSNASTQLQRHACNEVCVGLKPTICTTCSDMQLDAQDGEVKFTDLRTDISGKGYRLQISSSFFKVTSKAFDVVNSAPSYLQMEQQPSKTNRADLELQVQPVVSIRDMYGNLVLEDSVNANTIEVQISTLRGSPSASGLPDDPGQKSNPPIAGTRVVNATNAVAAFTDLAVRPSMADLQLYFLGTSSSGLLTVISDRFGVEPGEAVGLGIITLPGRCSALSPCIDAATIACVDAFGNVQPTCGTCLGSACNIRPYGKLPSGMNIPCFGKVCVSIIQPEDALLRMGSGGTDSLNCAEKVCGEEIDTVSGLATFTQLVLTVPSPMYILKFTTYLVNERSRTVYEWTYISPLLNNLPPQPVLTKAQFSASLSSIVIQFDRSTNMNLISGRDSTVSCDAVLDHTFVVTLGLGPACTWTSPSSYLILPGTGASAGPNTNVVLSNASYIVYREFFSGVEMTSLPASTTAGALVLGMPLKTVMLSLPDTIPRPVPILLGAEQLSSCDLLSLDAGLSQGSASRPFKGVRWSIDYDRTFMYQGMLTSEGSKLEFIKRGVHFSTRMPNLITTVTITLRPSAPVEGNSTLSISGFPQYHMSYSGCPAKPFHLGRPCLEARQECMAVHLAGPSAFKFASHLQEDPLEGQRVPVSWWQVGSVGNFFANIDVDRSKYLSQTEFTQALAEAGDFVSTDRSRQRFEAIDSDGDNLLSEKEFASTRPITGVPFGSLDLDGSLTVNVTELKFYFAEAGAQDYISKAQVFARFESLDMDQNGRVSSFEFGAAPALAMHSRHLQFHPAAFLGLNGGLQLQVHPSHYLAAGEDTVIQFQMQNPSLPYPARPIIISSRCVACTCSDRLCQLKTTKTFAATQMKMNCPDQLCHDDAVFKLDENPLSISGSISESTRIFGAHNILTLSFTTSHLLPPGSRLLLKGLPLLSRLPQGAAGNDVQMDLCLTGPSSLPLDCRSCEGAALAESGGAYGSWLPRAGEIRMQVRNGFSLAAGQHKLSFRFYNPTTTLRTPCQLSADGVKMVGQDCPSLATLTLQASYVYETLDLATAAILRTGVHGVLGAGKLPSWTMTQVSESNRFTGFHSHLFLELSADVDFGHLTHFTVEGFPQRNDVSAWGREPQHILALGGIEAEDGDISACFDPAKVSWNAAGTGLSFEIKHISASSSCAVAAGSTLLVAIPISNSNVTSIVEDLRIRAHHAGCRACVLDPCGCPSRARGITHPWSLPSKKLLGFKNTDGFGLVTYSRVLSANKPMVIVMPRISESNSVANQPASIAMSFQPPFDMLAGSTVLIEGLHPTATPSSTTFPIRNKQGIVRSGVFDALLGNLLFSLEQDAVANQILSVTFTLTHVSKVSTLQQTHSIRCVVHTPVCVLEENPLCARLPQATLGRIENFTFQANLTGNILRVSETRKLRVHAISEVSQVVNTLTIVTIDLQANFGMLAGYRVSISGLAGSSLSGEDAKVLTAVQDRIRLLPNCSCTTFEGVNCDCTGGRRSTNIDQFRIWQPDGFFGDPDMDGDLPVTETVKGTWTQSLGTLDVTIKANTNIAAESAWKFSFMVVCKRSALGISVPLVSVVDQAGNLVIDKVMMNGTMCQGAKSPDFTGVFIEEDSNVLSAQSNITLSISLASPLVSLMGVGAKITLSGLNGFQTPSGYIQLLGEHAYMFGKLAVAKWDRERSELVFEGVSLPANCLHLSDSCWLPDRWSVRFWLQNRASSADGQAFPYIEATSGIDGADKLGFGLRAIGGRPLGRATQVPKVTAASLTQNTDIQLAQNNLTLSLSFSINLPGAAGYSSSITVTGLVGILTPDNDALPLYGDDAALFAGKSALWRRAEGSLSLVVAARSALVAGNTVQISIVIMNPMKLQSAVSPKVRAEVRYSPNLWATSLAELPDAAPIAISPLLLPEIPISCRNLLASGTESTFTTKTVHESTQVNQASNTISVTLVCNIALPAGVILDFDGFVSSTEYNSGVMPISGTGAAILGNMAAFKRSRITDKLSVKVVLTTLVEPGEIISFYFVFQNPNCFGKCPGVPVTVGAKGGAGHPFIDIPTAVMHSQTKGVLGAGAVLSWTVKNIWETTNVRQEPNTMIINLQTNAPLYEGTQIVIKGLVSKVYETCFSCYTAGTLWALGSGCSVLCEACPVLPFEGVSGPMAACVPILQDEYSNPHMLFQDSLGFWNAGGDLTMTVKEGQKIDAENPFRVVLKMLNRQVPENRKECWRLNPASCLKVLVANGKLCSQMKPPIPDTWHRGEMCDRGIHEVAVASLSIDDGSPGMDHYSKRMLDTCATCLRPSDIEAVDRVLKMQTSLIISEARVLAPSIFGLPYFVSGGLVPGNYTIELELTNWIDQQSIAGLEFSKDRGITGQMRNEILKPTIYMQEYDTISGERASTDKPLSLLALAQPASCLPNAPRQVLIYEWTSQCLQGPCTLAPPLQTIARSRSTRSLDLAAYSLVAGATYRFMVSTQQEAFLESSQARTTVIVPVRNIVVDILGVNEEGTMGRGGEAKLKLEIFDPEVRTSGFNEHKYFHVTWGCMVQVESSACLLPFPAVCEPAPFVPCPHETLIAAPCRMKYGVQDSSCKHTASLTALILSKHYRIEVNVTRDIFSLPPAIYDYMIPRASLPVAWTARVRKTKSFQVVSDDRPVSASIMVCSAMDLGTPDLCAQPVPNKVNANEILVVKAVFQTSLPGIDILTQQWTVDNPADQGKGILEDSSNVLANVKEPLSGILILREGLLTAGHRLTLRLDAATGLSDTCSAKIQIQVRLAPTGGGLVVSPSTGVGMHTTFTLVAMSWNTDPDGLPLTYHFSCQDQGGESALEVPLRSGVAFSVQSYLPIPPASNRRLAIRVKVSDIHDASASSTSIVAVQNPALVHASELIQSLDTVLRTHVDAFFRVGDIYNAQVQVCLIAQSLNADPPCASDKNLGACKNGDIASRQVFRARLLLTVQAGNYSLVPSPGALTSQAIAFQKILDRPDEINFETADLAVRLLANNIRAIKTLVGRMKIDTQTLAYVHGISTIRLLESLRGASQLLFLRSANAAEHPNPAEAYHSWRMLNDDSKHAAKAGTTDEVSLRDTLERLRQARKSSATGRSRSQKPFSWEQDVLPSSRAFSSSSSELSSSAPSDRRTVAAARLQQKHTAAHSSASESTSRQSLTVSSLRNLQYKIMNELVAMVSSLSLSQAPVNRKPVVLHLPGCTINSSHVSVVELTKAGWKAEGNGSDVVATFTPAMLTQPVIGPALTGTSLEIMHVFWQRAFDKTLNLPQAFGPLSNFQLRRRGSDTPIQFSEPMTSAWQLQMPLTEEVPEKLDEFYGSRQIPFGAWFDEEGYNWHWNPRMLALKTRPSTGNGNLLTMSVFTLSPSLYSIFLVEEGCDGRDQSRVYQDHCAVCGGDNSTCSGCDGIPNTGRDKGCSKHGKCQKIQGIDEIKCACIDKWYDIMCSTYCDDRIHCSGHGMCHPDDGRSCICMPGWLAGDGKYPSPSCSERDPTVVTIGGVMDEKSIALEKAARANFLRTVLTAVLPAVCGAIVVGYVCFRMLFRYKLDDAKRRGTIITFPQPQLQIKAQDRIDNNVAIPDENGWTNLELPKSFDHLQPGREEGKGESALASGQTAKAKSANQKARVEELGEDSMVYRRKHMRWNVASKNTVGRYVVGPENAQDDSLDTLEAANSENGPQKMRQPGSLSNALSFLPFAASDITLVPRPEPRGGRPASQQRDDTIEVAI